MNELRERVGLQEKRARPGDEVSAGGVLSVLNDDDDNDITCAAHSYRHARMHKDGWHATPLPPSRFRCTPAGVVEYGRRM